MTFIYAPLPIEKYRLFGLAQDETTVIARSHYAAPLWNMFWLSSPSIDVLPGVGREWWKHYRPNEHAVSSMIRDLAVGDVLGRKLTTHPDRFITWFARTDQSGLKTYREMGRESWVRTVLDRADQAAARMAEQDLAKTSAILCRFTLKKVE